MPQHIEIACCTRGCFAIVTLHPSDEARLRRTHEVFYCPAGHPLHFAAKTDAEKEREQLERRVASADAREARLSRRWTEALEAGEFLAAGARVCPLGCGWTARRQARGLWTGDTEALGRYLDRVGGDVAEHLLHEHNATRQPVALIPERATSA